MCDIAECLDGLEVFEVPESVIELCYGYQDGRVFSAIIKDKRSLSHLHFPAADFAGFVLAVENGRIPVMLG